MRKLENGVLAKDKVTGFEGIVIGKTEWLTGCGQYILKAKAKEGELPTDGQWFDEGQLEVTGNGVHPEDVQTDEPGGPAHDTRKC